LLDERIYNWMAIILIQVHKLQSFPRFSRRNLGEPVDFSENAALESSLFDYCKKEERK
jgi:hypothetical protein